MRPVRLFKSFMMRPSCAAALSNSQRYQVGRIGTCSELAKLTTGSQDIASLALTDERVKTGCFQNGLEPQDLRLIGPAIGVAGELIERDEVDLATHPVE